MLLIFMKAECQVLFRDKQSRLVNHYCSSSSVVAIRADLQPTMVNFIAENNTYLINPSLFLNRTIYDYHSENWSGCWKCSTCISNNSSRPMVRFFECSNHQIEYFKKNQFLSHFIGTMT